jgi:hypothetical protein
MPLNIETRSMRGGTRTSRLRPGFLAKSQTLRPERRIISRCSAGTFIIGIYGPSNKLFFPSKCMNLCLSLNHSLYASGIEVSSFPCSFKTRFFPGSRHGSYASSLPLYLSHSFEIDATLECPETRERTVTIPRIKSPLESASPGGANFGCKHLVMDILLRLFSG